MVPGQVVGPLNVPHLYHSTSRLIATAALHGCGYTISHLEAGSWNCKFFRVDMPSCYHCCFMENSEIFYLKDVLICPNKGKQTHQISHAGHGKHHWFYQSKNLTLDV